MTGKKRSRPTPIPPSADLVPYELDESTRAQMETQLQSAEVPAELFPGFLEAIRKAIQDYRSGQAAEQELRPAAIRESLKALEKKAHALERELEQAPDFILELLREMGDFDAHDLLSGPMVELRSAVRASREHANQYQRRGRVRQLSREWLVLAVAQAVHRQLGIEPTSTRGGFYESILSLTFQAATGKEPENPHRQASEGVRLFKGDC